MFVTSLSSSNRPSFSAACFLVDAHVEMLPVVASPSLRHVAVAVHAAVIGPSTTMPPSSLPVETGWLAAFNAYSRRNTWCDACDV